MLCVCKCKREVMDEVQFGVFHENKYCEKCGEQFKGINQPVVGVRVKVEGGDYEDGRWIRLSELKKLLKLEVVK